MVLIFVLASATSSFVTPCWAIHRNWTGNSNEHWSNPDNWDPVGVPQNGDDLYFSASVILFGPGAMNNTLWPLEVHSLNFNVDSVFKVDWVLNGADLMITGGISVVGNVNVKINSNLKLTGDAVMTTIRDNADDSTELHLNNDIDLNGHTLGLFPQSFQLIKIPAVISGNGNVIAGGDFHNPGTVELSGPEGNTFRGTLTVSSTFNPNPNCNFYLGRVVLNKESGVAVTDRVRVERGGLLILGRSEQIGDEAIVDIVGTGANCFENQFPSAIQLNGYNETIATLNMVNRVGETNAVTLDTQGGLLIVLNGLTATNGASGIIPTIKGRLDFPGFLPLTVAGSSPAGLDITASISGNGFAKLGNGVLRLRGNNTFFGDVAVTQGNIEVYSSTAFGQAGPTYGVHLNGGSIVLENVGVGAEPLYVNPQSQGASFITTYNQCTWAGPVVLNSDLSVIPIDLSFTTRFMNFSGSISGPGGLHLQPALFAFGNVRLSGGLENTFTGPTVVNCQLLELAKSGGARPLSGPLIVGGAQGSALREVRWLAPYQIIGADLTVNFNGVVNLNNFNEDFGPVTFNGGRVETGNGQFAIYQPLTVNPSEFSAVINGYFGLPPGERVLYVGDGPVDCDLIINAVVFGDATYLRKQGPGTLCLANANTYTGVTLLEEGILDVSSYNGLGTASGTVIFGNATLRLSGAGIMPENFEIVGQGVGGSHGALEVAANGNFVLTGSMLLDAATTINVAQGALLSLNGALWGSGPLTKIGAGTLTFAGGAANTYSGDTIVAEGTLNLLKSDGVISVPNNLFIGPAPFRSSAQVRLHQFGPMGGSIVTVNANSVLDLNDRSLYLTRLNLNDGGSVQTGIGALTLADGARVRVGSLGPGASRVSSFISGHIELPDGTATFDVNPNAPVIFPGPALDVPAVISSPPVIFSTLFNKNGSGSMRLGGNNSFSSTLSINGGTLIAANSGALGYSGSRGLGSTYVNDPSTLALEGAISIDTEAIYLNSSASPALASDGVATLGGPISLSRNAIIRVDGSLQTLGVISGPGALKKIGPGTLTFGGSGNNAYAGDTFVQDGVLQLGKPIGVTAIPKHLIIGPAPSTPFAVAVARQVSGFSILGSVTVNQNGLWDLNGQAEGFTPSLLEGRPPLTLTDGGSVNTGSGIVYIPVGGDIVVNSAPGTPPAIITGAIGLDPGPHHINVSGAASNAICTIYATIGQTSTDAGVQKDGSGTLVLYGTNSYTGTTIANAGILWVNGIQPQSPVQVGNGARLQGYGTAGNLDFVGTTGVIAPGTSPAVLTCGNFNAGATGSGMLEIELYGTTPGPAGHDQLNVRGTVNLSNITLKSSLKFASSVSNQFVIINNDGIDPISGTFTGLAQDAAFYIGGELFIIRYDGGSGNDAVLTRLTTPPKPAILIQRVLLGAVRLSWPTNDPAYYPQFTTNLSSPNWSSALPAPVAIGTNYVLTNVTQGAQKFYRLIKP